MAVSRVHFEIFGRKVEENVDLGREGVSVVAGGGREGGREVSHHSVIHPGSFTHQSTVVQTLKIRASDLECSRFKDQSRTGSGSTQAIDLGLIWRWFGHA